MVRVARNDMVRVAWNDMVRVAWNDMVKGFGIRQCILTISFHAIMKRN